MMNYKIFSMIAVLLAALLFPPTPAGAVASGEYVVAHPKYSGVCGEGWKWFGTYYKAKNNKPRIMSLRIFYKGDRNFCVVVAREGKATGAKGATMAALVSREDSRIAHGNFAYYAVVKLKGDPCIDITGVVEYGEQKATKEMFICGTM